MFRKNELVICECVFRYLVTFIWNGGYNWLEGICMWDVILCLIWSKHLWWPFQVSHLITRMFRYFDRYKNMSSGIRIRAFGTPQTSFKIYHHCIEKDSFIQRTIINFEWHQKDQRVSFDSRQYSTPESIFRNMISLHSVPLLNYSAYETKS